MQRLIMQKYPCANKKSLDLLAGRMIPEVVYKQVYFFWIYLLTFIRKTALAENALAIATGM
jgi:hypothetical protein